ncbi:MAG TPA: UDP-N-acetylmuramate dehydrogenase [Candidatus Paceibacterota bacterium]|nr:UDP-N-acetylmuramate dehydrogenase [Candidatus Paceibacterota bacterium]
MPKFQENISLAKFSHYQIGGAARFFFEPKNGQEVAWAVAEAKARRLPMFILGGGTNLLLSDAGFDGLVIRPALASIEASGTAVEAGSGVSIDDLHAYLIAHSLSGFEWAGGLPGTLGGAIRGNAGCFGGETKDIVASVRSFDPETMQTVDRAAPECAFGYRDSVFKHGGAGEIILSAKLSFMKGDRQAIAQAVREKIEHRAKNHPLEYPNIGSMFKNVPLATVCREGSEKYEEGLAKGSVRLDGSRFSVKTDPFPVVSAAKLISESGLRGVSYGGAMISAKHPNFIVNVLGASSEDVKALMALAKAEVKRKFDVDLEEEVQIV